jgi:DNA repair protein RadC
VAELENDSATEINIGSLHTLRISVVREAPPLTDKLTTPRTAAEALRLFIPDDDPREHFVVLILDTRNRTVGVVPLSIGSMNGSLVHPREVFAIAVRELAAAVVLGHNHPSGDPAPSREDIELTKRLVEAGKVLGIEVLDHVIIGGENGAYHSFKETGLL